MNEQLLQAVPATEKKIELDIPRLPTLKQTESGGIISISAETLAEQLGDKAEMLAHIASLSTSELQVIADSINAGKNAADLRLTAIRAASEANVVGAVPFDKQLVLQGYYFVYYLQRYP